MQLDHPIAMPDWSEPELDAVSRYAAFREEVLLWDGIELRSVRDPREDAT